MVLAKQVLRETSVRANPVLHQYMVARGDVTQDVMNGFTNHLAAVMCFWLIDTMHA